MTAGSTPFADAAELAEIQTDHATIDLRVAGEASLAEVRIGASATVLALDLEPQLAAWLRAVGIGEGDRIEVLRAGAFGGPLHVRNASGGELAINRQLARSIRVNEVG